SIFIFLLPLHTVTALLNCAWEFWLPMILSAQAILLLGSNKPLSCSLGFAFSIIVLLSYELFFPLIYGGLSLSTDWLQGFRLKRRDIGSLTWKFAVLTAILLCYTGFREFMGHRPAIARLTTDSSIMEGLHDVILSALVGGISSFGYIGE